MNNEIICPNCGENNPEDLQKCSECDNLLILNGKYKLIKVLGENIGITYLGVNIKNNEKVVIKELAIKAIDRWKTEELFKREGNILKSFSNESIPEFREQFTIEIDKNIVYFLIMEFIEGETLEENLKSKIYTESEVFEIIKKITEILDYLHNFRPPVIHRDIKPSNLIVKPDNEIVLIDFGGVKDAINPNMGSTVAGTFGFAPPEQLLGKASIQSDYYALGMTALVLLTRRKPEDLSENLNFQSENYSFLSNKMKFLLSKLLSKDLKTRIKSTKEISEVLNAPDNEFENRNIITKANSSDAIEASAIYYRNMDNMWELSKREYKRSKWISIGIHVILWSILLILMLNFKEHTGKFIYVYISVAMTILFKVNKEGKLKKFLDKAITHANETECDIELIYAYYENAVKKGSGTLSEKSREYNLFKEYLDKNERLNKTKLLIYRKTIHEYRGHNENNILP